MLYGNLARQLPLMIHQAAQGDFDLFLNTFVPLEPQPAEPDGHYWSVVCPEETSRLEPEEVIAAAQGTFLGTYTSDEYIAACQEWGLPVHPGHPIEAQTFNIPALVITGDQDPATPPQYGREIVSHFEGGLHINVPHMGHGGSTVQNAECLDQILADFVDRGTTEGLDTTCVETIRPHPFRLD
jgi:pimeloyl-ACP methyl ester carboxylesterase